MEAAMPYGTKTALPGALALTGFALGSWVIAAVTLLFIGITILHLVRQTPAMRP
ncbi:MAG: hypothetical protein ACYDH6_09075 [Acidimicrobiales bacterium]